MVPQFNVMESYARDCWLAPVASLGSLAFLRRAEKWACAKFFFRNSKEGVHYNMLTESNLNKICAERLPETCSLSGQALRPSVTRALIFIEPGDSTSSQVVHSKLALVCRKAWPDKEQVSGNRSAQILFKLLSVNIL